jgi:hypothetical protein
MRVISLWRRDRPTISSQHVDPMPWGQDRDSSRSTGTSENTVPGGRRHEEGNSAYKACDAGIVTLNHPVDRDMREVRTTKDLLMSMNSNLSPRDNQLGVSHVKDGR